MFRMLETLAWGGLVAWEILMALLIVAIMGSLPSVGDHLAAASAPDACDLLTSDCQ